MTSSPVVEDLLRELTPQVLTAVAAGCRDFAAAEDAVQEALLAAAAQWPAEGVAANPAGWLIRVAQRRLIDEFRADTARTARETALGGDPTSPFALTSVEAQPVSDSMVDDDTLTLLMLCCHPCLSPAAAIALTLRAVGGLTTAQIAAAFLVPEATMGQRISRAKQRIRASGAHFELPAPADRAARLASVRQVIYLMFNEGYVSAGESLDHRDLAVEAIRIARILAQAQPEHPEVTGLLALLLLTHARRPARSDADGYLVPLAEQDRSRWDPKLIGEGRDLLLQALARGAVGPYQVQAAIAALHDEASCTAGTDWSQIVALYTLLEQMTPGPMVTLSRAVALGTARGPLAGLALLDTIEGLEGHHRLHAVRAHLLERAGRLDQARLEFATAAGLTRNIPEKHYLTTQAARLGVAPASAAPGPPATAGGPPPGS